LTLDTRKRRIKAAGGRFALHVSCEDTAKLFALAYDYEARAGEGRPSQAPSDALTLGLVNRSAFDPIRETLCSFLAAQNYSE